MNNSVWGMKLVDIIDELGFLVIDGDKAFNAAIISNKTDGGTEKITGSAALRALEDILSIKIVPSSLIFHREDGTDAELVNSSFSHSQFLRSLLRFMREEKYFESKSHDEDCKKSAPAENDPKSNTFERSGCSSKETEHPPHKDSEAKTGPYARSAPLTHHSEEKLDEMRRSRVRRLETDAFQRNLPTTIAPPRPSSHPPAESKSAYSLVECRVIERADFPACAELTEPLLIFISLQYWEQLALYHDIFMPPADAKSLTARDKERARLCRIATRSFAALDREGLYYHPTGSRPVHDMAILHSDFSGVMNNPILKLSVKVSSSQAWTATREWWDQKLREISPASGLPGATLSWTIFLVTFQALAKFAFQQAAKLKFRVVTEIWEHVRNVAVRNVVTILSKRESERWHRRKIESERAKREARERTESRRLDRRRSAHESPPTSPRPNAARHNLAALKVDVDASFDDGFGSEKVSFQAKEANEIVEEPVHESSSKGEATAAEPKVEMDADLSLSIPHPSSDDISMPQKSEPPQRDTSNDGTVAENKDDAPAHDARGIKNDAENGFREEVHGRAAKGSGN